MHHATRARRLVPCLVLICAEEQNWFTFLQTCLKKQFMNIVTITEDDDACSAYGINKVKARVGPVLIVSSLRVLALVVLHGIA